MKKILKKLSLTLLLTTGLVSCVGNQTNGNGTAELPEDDPTSEVTITFWHCLGHDKEENLNKIVNSFNSKYQGKYKVELVKLAGGYDELADATKSKLSAGEVPALAMGYPDTFSEYMTNSIDESSILNVESFIKDEKFGYSEAEINDFVPAFYNEGRNYQFEGTWSMPMYKSTEVMYYNANYLAGSNPASIKKLGQDAKYTELRQKVESEGKYATEEDLAALKDYTSKNGGYTYDVPETWDEMITVARKMDQDRKEQAITDEFFPVGYDSDANLLISQFAQQNIDYTTNDESTKEDSSNHFKFNNDKAKSLVKGIVDDLITPKLMITKGILGGGKYTNTYEGKAAMVVGSTGGSSYNVSSNFRVSLAHVPYTNNNPKYIQQGPSICFFNNFDNYVHKGAWLFYKELASPENNAALALENSYDPIRLSSYETSQYKEYISNSGKGELGYDIPKITSTLKENYMTSPVFVGSATARKEMDKIFANVVNSKMSIDEAFTAAFNACKASIQD